MQSLWEEIEYINTTSMDLQHSDDIFFKKYTFKNEFYGDYDLILEKISTIGLQEDTFYLLGASIGELVDNSFFHNLGRWPTLQGPIVYVAIRNDAEKRTLEISICDLGVGFSGTLKDKYPDIQEEEEEFISIALKPGITGRYQNIGGNGLVFLQKNVFNGFHGKLYIRSNNTLVEVTHEGTVGNIQNNEGKIGAHVYLIISY